MPSRAESAPPRPPSEATGISGTAPAAADGAQPVGVPDAGAAEGPEPSAHPVDATAFHRQIEKRQRRWRARIAADWSDYDRLDDARLHALRKRIKRQRYAVKFVAPVLRRYLGTLATVQDRMGELNDLFVGRANYKTRVATDPAAWFALGWLAARISEVRALARSELKRLVKKKPPVG